MILKEASNEVQMLIEDVPAVNGSPASKKYWISGIFMQANKKNRNGRVYPLELLQREASRYTVNYINQNRALSELGHPESPTINLDRVSHIIKDLHQEGTDFFGKALILDTPYGKIVQEFLKNQVKLGVSTRGLGSLRNVNGVNMVQDDFFLAAIDIVADPSASDAFVTGLMENKEFKMINEDWKREAQQALQAAHRADKEEVTLRLFDNFLKSLK